jgi:hypothetical protein
MAAEAELNSNPIIKKDGPINMQFWLVSTVQVRNIDYVSEITSLKIFTKWWMKNDVHKDFEYNEKNLSSFLWSCDGTPCDDEMIKKLLSNKMVKNCTIRPDAESKYFPVNPTSIMLNDTGSSQENCGPNWVQILDSNSMSCQIVFTVELHTPFHMREYPFDRHLIPLTLSTRSWKDENKIKNVWSLDNKKPNWILKSYPEDDYCITENLTWLDPKAEMIHLKPILKLGKKPNLCIRVERDPTYFVFTVAAPICAIVLLCMESFCLDFNNGYDRLNSVLISALVIAAFKVSIQDTLPKKSYLTYADHYLLTCFIFHFIMVLKIVLCYQGLGNGVGFFWYEDGEDDEYGYNKSFQYVDDGTTWLLILTWSLFHSVFIYDVMTRTRIAYNDLKLDAEGSQGFLDYFLRPNWNDKASNISVSEITNHGFNTYSIGKRGSMHGGNN